MQCVAMYPVCVVRVCFRMGQSLIQWPQSVHPQARLCTGEHMQYSSVLARFLSALGLSQGKLENFLKTSTNSVHFYFCFLYIYHCAVSDTTKMRCLVCKELLPFERETWCYERLAVPLIWLYPSVSSLPCYPWFWRCSGFAFQWHIFSKCGNDPYGIVDKDRGRCCIRQTHILKCISIK